MKQFTKTQPESLEKGFHRAVAPTKNKRQVVSVDQYFSMYGIEHVSITPDVYTYDNGRNVYNVYHDVWHK